MMAWIYTIIDYKNPSKEINNFNTGPQQLKPLKSTSFTQQVIIKVYYMPGSFLIRKI